MKLGMVGLGKMGANMVTRLLLGEHEVVATDLAQTAIDAVVEEGAEGAKTLSELIDKLEAPKVVWLMLPSGGPTEGVFTQCLELLSEGDIIVDGANSNWHDSMARAKTAQEHGVHFVDCGVSGGVWGLKEGYNLMVGASDTAFEIVEPALKTLAPEDGYAHLGPSGSGHFVKMIHNGIEYAIMQAYGEGFEAMSVFPHAHLDLDRIAELWLHGSVIRSWLLELAADAFSKDARFDNIEDYVNDSGMGRWTVQYGVDNAVPLPAITAALYARFSSRQSESFAAKLAAALRNEFGGHAVKVKDAAPLAEKT